ncbi:MAG: iron-containing alcohol dehydrogenase [Verrucomicrobia bacterium]|jgi:alcohol dehydrogenase class IV|nr:iron-containing alcohol dehydrogenase [Verrucomicrobiota bacterium]
MTFEFATAQRIRFGPGTLREAGPAARAFGRRALIVTGRTPGRAAPLLDALHAAGVEACTFDFAGEPTTDLVLEGRAIAKTEQCNVVIGFGGGSALDAAKAIAALLTNDGDLFDHLEVVGRGQPLQQPAAPCIAIPTTAGTGAEVTRNSVLAVPAQRLKVSLRSPLLLPRLAIVDPELTHSLPPEITAITGMDALTQLIEPYVSPRANPLVDALCADGIARAARSLRRAVEEGGNPGAREDMALASLFGGLALANAGLGAVHGFAAPIGGMFPAPHGAVCAALLPHVMAANVQALRARQPDSPALIRYDQVARLLTGRADAVADDAVSWVAALGRALRIKPLGRFGLRPPDFAAVVEKAAQASSMKANPVALTPGEMTAILASAA